jgi:hypothetical protein
METNPAGNIMKPAGPLHKTWKDYIGWAGFVVTAGILLEQAYMHSTGLWYIFYNTDIPLNSIFSDPQYSLLYRITTIFGVLTCVFFALYPLVALVLLLLRKKAVPGLLVIFAAVAACTNTATEVLYNLLAAEYKQAVYVSLSSVVYLAIDILLILFYLKSKRFKALFVR